MQDLQVLYNNIFMWFLAIIIFSFVMAFIIFFINVK